MGYLSDTISRTFFQFGGTGGTAPTPRANDIVYASPWEEGTNIAGVSVTQDKALNYVPFYAAVRIISEDVAGLPLNVYTRRSDGGREIDQGHWAQRLLHNQPNPEMTAFTWRETAMAHVLTWGNHYSEIEYATDGSIVALWPLRPDSMTMARNAAGEMVYRYRVGSGETVELPRRKVFHLHGLGFDGRMGYSVVSRLRRALALGIATETHGTNAFDKGMIPPAVLKTPQKLSPDTFDRLEKSMENWRGLNNRQRIAILEEGLDLTAIGIPNDDAKFIETLEHAGTMMATGFRIPPSMLGFVNRSTSWGSGIEQQQIGYVTHTLRGWLVRSEQQYNMSILADDDRRYVKHVVDGLLRGDSAARWAAYNSALDRGVYSIDDVLEMEDRNPLPDGLGQRHFVPLNMAPLDQMGEMSMRDRLQLLAALTTAGINPANAAEVIEKPADAPDILADMEPMFTNGNGSR